jgi:hypothetical protein
MLDNKTDRYFIIGIIIVSLLFLAYLVISGILDYQ